MAVYSEQLLERICTGPTPSLWNFPVVRSASTSTSIGSTRCMPRAKAAAATSSASLPPMTTRVVANRLVDCPRRLLLSAPMQHAGASSASKHNSRNITRRCSCHVYPYWVDRRMRRSVEAGTTPTARRKAVSRLSLLERGHKARGPQVRRVLVGLSAPGEFA